MREDLGKVLLDEASIGAKVAELAGRISADYAGTDPVILGTLKGSFIFLADLVRHLDFALCLDFVSARSYGDGAVSCGEVALELGCCGDLAGRHVLVVEDIVDTGRTLSALVSGLQALGCASVRTCCLLDKPARRKVEITPDYVGFEIPDEFVVGYGLDYAEKYRNLPFIAVLKREVYES